MIPNQAHFIWLGREFPWVHALALRSAAVRGGFSRVVLHHDADLSSSAAWRDLKKHTRIEMKKIDYHAIFSPLGTSGTRMQKLFYRLTSPAAKANVLRVALLATSGGVYLDTDTITLRTFGPLLNDRCFCGSERIALPSSFKRSKQTSKWAKAGFKLVARDLCRRLPRGWRSFKRIERFYSLELNNAVLGAEPGNPFFQRLIEQMVTMPKEDQSVRYALGPHLLQSEIAHGSEQDLRVHPPAVFYPLPPEISEHWFRPLSGGTIDELVAPQTVAVHWYASVRTKNVTPLIDAAYVRAHATTIPFCKLARPYA